MSKIIFVIIPTHKKKNISKISKKQSKLKIVSGVIFVEDDISGGLLLIEINKYKSCKGAFCCQVPRTLLPESLYSNKVILAKDRSFN